MDGQSVHAARQFRRKNTIDQAMTFDSGLIFERIRYNIDPIVSLPAFAVAGMPGMQVGFVVNLQALRC